MNIPSNQEWAANYWLDNGCPKEKFLIGMPTYGRSFRLQSSTNTGYGAPATGAAPAGAFTREGGFYSYYEVGEWPLPHPQRMKTFFHGHFDTELPQRDPITPLFSWMSPNRSAPWLEWPEFTMEKPKCHTLIPPQFGLDMMTSRALERR